MTWNVCEQCRRRIEGNTCPEHLFEAEIQEMSRRHHFEQMELTAKILEFKP